MCYYFKLIVKFKFIEIVVIESYLNVSFFCFQMKINHTALTFHNHFDNLKIITTLCANRWNTLFNMKIQWFAIDDLNSGGGKQLCCKMYRITHGHWTQIHDHHECTKAKCISFSCIVMDLSSTCWYECGHINRHTCTRTTHQSCCG